MALLAGGVQLRKFDPRYPAPIVTLIGIGQLTVTEELRITRGSYEIVRVVRGANRANKKPEGASRTKTPECGYAELTARMDRASHSGAMQPFQWQVCSLAERPVVAEGV
ncbi:hypothetical protein PTKU46_90450 [Paraburkholderia terrae]